MSKFVYTGQENLEAMKAAVNYNNYLLEFVLKQVGKRKNVKILDFGAGIGTYADMLKAKGIKVDCFEIDQSQLELLRSKGYDAYDDINKLGSYDMIYSFNVFEHISNDKQVFASLCKKLAKGGRVITYVPAFQSLYSSMDTLVGHERRYRKKRLQEMASEAELVVTDLSYRDPIGFFASLAFKYLGNDHGVISVKSVKAYDKFVFPLSKLIESVTTRLIGKNALMIAEKS